MQAGQKGLTNLILEPLPGLRGTRLRPIPVRLAPVGEGLQVGPDPGQPVFGKCRNRHGFWKARRVLRAATHKLQSAGIVCNTAQSGRFQIAVGLVYKDQIGHFHDPALDALQLIPASRRKEEEEKVAKFGHHGFGLTDADGFDQHDVKACRLAQGHRLTRAAGDAAEVRLAGRGADEGKGVARQTLHPCLVAKDRPAGAGRGRVDRQHGNLEAHSGQHKAERLDEGGFPDAGGA